MIEKHTRRGFTLIELLVVVIIIAILAAIALPQYQKSVMKSRFAALKPIAKSVKDAQEIYFNREGHYAGESELGDLDIGIPEGTSLDISATGDHLYVRANNPTGLPHNSYTMYLNQSGNYAGNIYCEAYTGDTVAENLCIAEGGQTGGPQNGDYTLYLLSGNSTGEFAASAPTIFDSPKTAFHSLYETLAACGNDTCTTGLFENALANAGVTCTSTSGEGDANCTLENGDEYHWFNSSAATLNVHQPDGTRISVPYRFYSDLVVNPTVSCSGPSCNDICGSTDCSIALDDW